MDALQIRKGVRPDIGVIKGFDHSVKTSFVWQMQQRMNENEISTTFIQSHLPRDMRLVYPRSPELLESTWGDFSTVLIACMDLVPVGYLTINAYFSPDLAWIKDLVVHENWREKGIASTLIEKAVEWAIERMIPRLTLEASSKNYPGIKLANKMKFEFSGFDDNYFQNKDIAVFFTRDLRKRLSG